ncbi:hypothetical protein Hypma_008232 [Hypsizygus marmoreus]|uniref:Uncharacterized protein n=1 Tax=Hypsizygus marmoreus TaxID=39966 RepID=A0A369JS07_HYPMA|nr:hypothetical protein Hypma_008232 [Hypsizygus marmoreus]
MGPFHTFPSLVTVVPASTHLAYPALVFTSTRLDQWAAMAHSNYYDHSLLPNLEYLNNSQSIFLSCSQ